MVTLTQEDIKKLFEYLNTQPYKFSAPLFEFFYTKMKEEPKDDTGGILVETEVPKKRTNTKS